jgi:hypothetical protein
MKKRIALGAAMLLTLGTAVAGTFLYGHEQAATVEHSDEQMSEQQITLPSDTSSSAEERSKVSTVTPEQIAMWKATAASTDYEAPKAPI